MNDNKRAQQSRVQYNNNNQQQQRSKKDRQQQQQRGERETTKIKTNAAYWLMRKALEAYDVFLGTRNVSQRLATPRPCSALSIIGLST
jgi:molecular chaperone GrpE (heat shock protein)